MINDLWLLIIIEVKVVDCLEISPVLAQTSVNADLVKNRKHLFSILPKININGNVGWCFHVWINTVSLESWFTAIITKFPCCRELELKMKQLVSGWRRRHSRLKHPQNRQKLKSKDWKENWKGRFEKWLPISKMFISLMETISRALLIKSSILTYFW